MIHKEPVYDIQGRVVGYKDVLDVPNINTSKENLMHNLGKQAKDKITGFEGVIVSKISYLFGCEQYGIASEAKDGKLNDTCYFDEGRVEVTGDGVAQASVKGKNPGGVNRDAPSRIAR